MTGLAAFVRLLLSEGRILVRDAPAAAPDRDALPHLERAYHTHALAIAGPPLPFDTKTALAAAQALHVAAWFFLNPHLPVEERAKELDMPAPPKTPAQHLSADVVFRFLPGLYRRAHALLPNDAITANLARLLRLWPLGGVLADLPDAPLTPPDFDGHAGLCLLYAERLARHEKPGWFPTGAGLPYVELVWEQLGRDTSLLPLARAVAQSLAADPKESS
jgi:MoxR-vWA-beta-propeller ternary system domain bpX4